MTEVNWRSLEVVRDRAHEPLVHHLMSQNVFSYNKELMVFAALVGYSEGKKKPLSADTIKITLDTYSSDDLDGFIYLMALIESKNGTCLKDENLRSSIRIYEEYCNAGLEIIQEWLDSNSADLQGIDTILQKVYEKILSNENNDDVDNEEIEFDLD